MRGDNLSVRSSISMIFILCNFRGEYHGVIGKYVGGFVDSNLVELVGVLFLKFPFIVKILLIQIPPF